MENVLVITDINKVSLEEIANFNIALEKLLIQGKVSTEEYWRCKDVYTSTMSFEDRVKIEKIILEKLQICKSA